MNTDTDYCIDPNFTDDVGRSTTAPVPQPTTPIPTAGSPPPPAPTAGSPPQPAPTAGSYTPISNNNSCSPTSPCQKCAGDCDLDSDCMPGLVCPNRDGGEPIPGCIGTDSSSKHCTPPSWCDSWL